MGENVQSHTVVIRDRKNAEFTGVCEVENFHEAEISLSCVCGAVVIEGSGLKIESFSVETGKMEITGSITGLFYYEKPDKSGMRRGGLFARHQK